MRNELEEGGSTRGGLGGVEGGEGAGLGPAKVGLCSPPSPPPDPSMTHEVGS